MKSTHIDSTIQGQDSGEVDDIDADIADDDDLALADEIGAHIARGGNIEDDLVFDDRLADLGLTFLIGHPLEELHDGEVERLAIEYDAEQGIEAWKGRRLTRSRPLFARALVPRKWSIESNEPSLDPCLPNLWPLIPTN